MDYAEFQRAFRQALKMDGVRRFHGDCGAIRLKIGSSLYCPITLVYKNQTQETLSTSNFHTASEVLGLAYELRQAIVNAADNYTTDNFRHKTRQVRRYLLRVLREMRT